MHEVKEQTRELAASFSEMFLLFLGSENVSLDCDVLCSVPDVTTALCNHDSTWLVCWSTVCVS